MPTITIQPSDNDGAVKQAEPTTNFDGESTMTVAGSPGANRRVLVHFDTSAITTEKISAKMNLNASVENNVTLSVHDLQAALNEATVTWDNQPAHNATAITSKAVTSTGYNEFDVINSDFLYGFLIKTAESESIALTTFYTSEDGNTGRMPKLTIVYRNASPTITAPASTTLATPTSYSNELTPNITATLAGYTITKFRVYIYSGANLYFDSGEVTGAAVNYNVPLSAELEYNHTYGVKVSGLDSDGNWTEISAMHYLTCAIGAIDSLATSDVTAGVKLDWTASAAESITGYNIYRSLTTGTGFTLLDTTTSNTFTDYKVASGTTYYYTVKVREGTNESLTSNEVNNSIVYSGWYLNGTVLPVKYGSYSRQRRNHSTSREIIGQAKNTVQSEGLGGNILTLTAITNANSTMLTIEALLSDVVTLHHSTVGQWKVMLTSDPQINDNGYTQEMRLTFEEVE